MNTPVNKTRKIALAAVFAAATLVMTMFVSIPIPSTSGYVNLGDSVIYAAAFALGGPIAALAAAIGSALADILLGAAVYAPATAVIKGLMALAVGTMLHQHVSFKRYIIAAVVGSIIMIAGYWLYETVVFGLDYAAFGVPFNCLQGGGSLIISAVLYSGLRKLRAVKC